MSNVQYTAIRTEEGQKFITCLVNGKLQPPVDDTHPNFDAILGLCQAAYEGDEVDTDHLIELFDVEETIRVKFERLSDRVTVKNGVIHLDGDPVDGSLQDQILSFLDAGEEFEPLVRFYEKMLTNPLGNVTAGLYDWINGQTAEGNFTITPEGDILGYKSVKRTTPEWRTDLDEVFVPSQRGEGIVNGRDVAETEFIEQVPGDTVEMPRSRVLNAPSRACGDGLHIGTWSYAKNFYGGDTVMLVQFNPRDIVSLPDRNSTWKLRVCRYEVIGPVDAPLEAPVWSPTGVKADRGWSSGDEVEPNEVDLDLSLDTDSLTWHDSEGTAFGVGARVKDEDDDQGTVTGADEDDDPVVKFDNAIYGEHGQYADDLTVIGSDSGGLVVGDRVTGTRSDGWGGQVEGNVTEVFDDGSMTITADNGETHATPVKATTDGSFGRIHGKGGPTSVAARGNGRNPAQDKLGRFSAGRPGSNRDSSTGRFA